MKRFTLAFALLLATPIYAQPAPFDRQAVEAVVHDYILSHPEIIPEAVQILQDKQRVKLLSANRAKLETPFAQAWEGAEHGDVTVVEFYDYNCPYCKLSGATIRQLLAEDKNVKIVYRELPVLGDASDTAALYSLALASSSQWPKFHESLFKQEKPNHEGIVAAAHENALPLPTVAKLALPAYRTEINANLGLAQKLNIDGTPGWVIGNKIYAGFLDIAALKAAIAEARKAAAPTLTPIL
jgi:protein-disulfide isomerase